MSEALTPPHPLSLDSKLGPNYNLLSKNIYVERYKERIRIAGGSNKIDTRKSGDVRNGECSNGE